MATKDALFSDSTDQYGYTRYSIVVHVPVEPADKIQRFREAIGMADFKTEPHISISAALYDLDDMDALKAAIRDIAASLAPLRILFADPPFIARADIGFFEIAPTPELLKLRNSVVEALNGIIKSNTQPDRPYWPHMTLYQSATVEENGRATEIGPTLELGDGFDASSLDLVGRAGTPGEGIRHIIETFPFSK